MDNKFIMKVTLLSYTYRKATGFSWDGFWASKNNETQLFRAILSTMIATSHMWLCTLKWNKTENSAPQARWSQVPSPSCPWLVAPVLHGQCRDTERFSLQRALLGSDWEELGDAGLQSAFMFFLLAFSVFSISVYFFNQSFCLHQVPSLKFSSLSRKPYL